MNSAETILRSQPLVEMREMLPSMPDSLRCPAREEREPDTGRENLFASDETVQEVAQESDAIQNRNLNATGFVILRASLVANLVSNGFRCDENIVLNVPPFRSDFLERPSISPPLSADWESTSARITTDRDAPPTASNTNAVAGPTIAPRVSILPP